MLWKAMLMMLAATGLVTFSVDPSKAIWSAGEFRKVADGTMEMTLCAFAQTGDGGWLEKKCLTFIPNNTACQNTIENQGMQAWRAKFYP